MNDAHDWQELIDRHLRGELSESEKERLAERLDSDPAARQDFVEQVQWDTRISEVLRDSRGSLHEPIGAHSADGLFAQQTAAFRRTPRITFTRALLAIAAVIIVALTASLYFQHATTEPPIEKNTVQQPRTEQPIAKITGLSGPLQWTGDGGRVYYDSSAGAELAGGTVEGLAPGSWLELEFSDGSTVTVSGSSTLTFSDRGQKELYLKEGTLSCNAKPQPAHNPMLLYTRSARLEILGTQFKVEAGLVTTTLNVSEGKVRVKRFSDGSTVDVPAKYRVIAAPDRELRPVPAPDSVTRWRSLLHLGPEGTQGKWSPGTDPQGAKLATIPYTTRQGKTIYTAVFEVSRGDKPPVTLQPASRVRVRGHMASPQKVYVGVTVRQTDGEFAGRFQTVRPALEFPSGQDFEVVLDIRDFRLDSSLREMKNKLPSDPFHLVVESIWCHTLDKQAGLEIAEVELIPPTELQSE